MFYLLKWDYKFGELACGRSVDGAFGAGHGPDLQESRNVLPGYRNDEEYVSRGILVVDLSPQTLHPKPYNLNPKLVAGFKLMDPVHS